MDESRTIPIEELYMRFSPYVAAIASRILGREEEVRDVVQDVFTASVRGMSDRSDALQARAWLGKVAVRESVRKRRKRNTANSVANSPGGGPCPFAPAGPYELRLAKEVNRVLETLEPLERSAWFLRHVENERLEEVARLCECSLATAKRRIRSAQEKIRSRFDRTEPLPNRYRILRQPPTTC